MIGKNVKNKVFIISLGLFLVDRTTKWWVLDYKQDWLSKNIGLFWFELDKRIIIGLSIIILIVLSYLVIRRKQNQPGWWLIIFGGLANLIDRLVYGFVIDWIKMPVISISVFNLADVMIVLGLLLIGLTELTKDCLF